MYTKDLIKLQIQELGIKPYDTVLMHSSMKSVGAVEGGADTVLDAFMEYLHDGLFVLPTLSWSQINDKRNLYDPQTEPSCVGILTNIFMKRPNVYRSLHPTHSVAAAGNDAQEYVSGEEKSDTPCSRNGCWGKLYDRGAKVLFAGCGLKCNTLVHGAEEWNKVHNRLTDTYQELKILKADGTVLDRPMRRHYSPTGRGISGNYDKIAEALFYKGIACEGKIGDAKSILCEVRKMIDLVSSFLKRDQDLFLNNDKIPEDWYK